MYNLPKLNSRYIASVSSTINANRKKNFLYAMLTGTGIGTGYAVWQSKPLQLPDITDISFKNSIDKRNLSSYIKQEHRNSTNVDGARLGKLTLYQFFSCPFCCKVRAYLDYYGIDYDIVEVNSVTKSQLKWSDYKKVPILVAEDESTQINDSNVIISALEAKRNNKNLELKSILPLYGPTVKQNKRKIVYTYSNVYNIPGVKSSENDTVWRSWVDKNLLSVAGLSIYETMSEAIRSFKWFAKAGKWPESFGSLTSNLTVYSGACVMYAVSKLRQRKKLPEDPTFETVIHSFSNKLSSSPGDFIGGEIPNLADVSSYGALMALSGCDKFSLIMTDKVVAKWWQQMKEQIENNAGGLNEIHNQENKPENLFISTNSILPALTIFLIVKLIGVGLTSNNVI